MGWAIDFGTSHTRVARWDAVSSSARLVRLPDICRLGDDDNPLDGSQLIPSETHVLPNLDWKALIGRWPFVRQRWFIGQMALIGRQAQARNLAGSGPSHVPSFKRFLEAESRRVIAHCGGQGLSARQVFSHFARELLSHIKATTGERLRKVTLTAPVEAFESYRAELKSGLNDLGVRRVNFIDEPVAAALGYGVNVDDRKVVLVVDFGGGTLDLALVRLTPRQTREGSSDVLAKCGRALGGRDIDRWLTEAACKRHGFDLNDSPDTPEALFWRRLMLSEAQRVKEALFFEPSSLFAVSPPAVLRGAAQPRHDAPELVEFSKADLIATLEANFLSERLTDAMNQTLLQAESKGISADDIDEVLLVGGSTLLPTVYELFEHHFGRDRVRAWQPFEAVSFGAAAFSAGMVPHEDHLVHDYALVTHDPVTHEPGYTLIVPRGTTVPTDPHLWRRQLTPTCSLGAPESFFKLVVCEIGRGDESEVSFLRDDQGNVHRVGEGHEKELVIKLNEAHPTMGYLDPPHSPSEKQPRIEMSFGVNRDRWLIATALDLKTREYLLKEEPVIRLI